MHSFSEQCLDMARSMLAHNLDSVQPDGTVLPAPGEQSRPDEAEGDSVQHEARRDEAQPDDDEAPAEHRDRDVGRAVHVGHEEREAEKRDQDPEVEE